MDIDIIGGGYAGCAAAFTLLNSGHRIRIWESRSVLGGRARRICTAIPPAFQDHQFDNGQHLLAGAYHTLIDLIQSVHGSDPVPWKRMPLALYLAGHAEPWFKPASLPAPFNILGGMLTLPWPWPQRLHAINLLRRLQQHAFQQTHPRLNMVKPYHPHLFDQLLEPLCLAILNTPVHEACTTRFMHILERAFQTRRDSDAILPTVDLSALFPDRVAHLLEKSGHSIHCNSRIRAIVPEPDGSWQLVTSDGSVKSDAVILATAPDQVAPLLMHIPATSEHQALRSWINILSYAPIATAYFSSTMLPSFPYPMLQLNNQPGQWLFDRGSAPSLNSRYYSIVISAADHWLTLAPSERERALASQLQAAFNNPAFAFNGLWTIVEKRATYRVKPGLIPPSKARLIRRLYVAGDYFHPLLPATLESAVQSGITVARQWLTEACL